MKLKVITEHPGAAFFVAVLMFASVIVVLGWQQDTKEASEVARCSPMMKVVNYDFWQGRFTNGTIFLAIGPGLASGVFPNGSQWQVFPNGTKVVHPGYQTVSEPYNYGINLGYFPNGTKWVKIVPISCPA